MRLSSYLESLENVEEQGDGYLSVCPAHSDTHPSLRSAVSPEGHLMIKCRAGCSTGSVVEALGLSFSDLFDIEVDRPALTARSSAEPLSTGDRAQMMAYLRSCADRLQTEEGALAASYLLDRFGVDLELASALGLGYDPGGGVESFYLLGGVYQQVPRVVVPFRDAEGRPSGFQSRALLPHKVRWAGPTNPPEGGSWSKLAFFDSGSGTDFVVVTEGPGDALTAVAAGVDSVGIRGAALAEGTGEALSEALRGRRVVLAGDGDRAGGLMNETLGARLHDLGLLVHVLRLPEGVGDITDWAESCPEDFSDIFQAAVFSAPPWEPPVDPEETDEDGYSLLPSTHVEVARMVVDNLDGRLVYILGIGFHLFEGGVWTEDRLGRVRISIHEIGDHYAEELELLQAEHPEEVDRITDLRRFVRFVRSTVELDRIEKEVRGLVLREAKDFDSHPHLLAVRNGVVDLRSGELRPHDPSLFLTQKVDVDYRPEASAPRWESFLEEVFPGSPGMADFIRRLVGYGITGETVEQCFAVLWGRGANGKSVFTETLLEVFEGISKATPFSTFEDRKGGSGIPNDIAALRGSRLVFASEGERGKPMAESVLKRVTGQDMISARFMRQEFFEFRPSFLLFMASNHKPNFLSADEGLWRRVKLVPWSRYFSVEERDPYLRQRLVSEESEGILAWAVRGAVEWKASGLGDPSEVVQATAAYRDSSDRLAPFFPHGPLRKDEDSSVLAKEVWEAYVAWCDEEMLPPKERWGRSTLYNGLEERGLEKVRRKDGVRFLGATLGSL